MTHPFAWLQRLTFDMLHELKQRRQARRRRRWDQRIACYAAENRRRLRHADRLSSAPSMPDDAYAYLDWLDGLPETSERSAIR